MSYNSIARAAVDPQLINRVTSAAYQVIQTDAEKAGTVFGLALAQQQAAPGMANPVAPLMWPVAIITEEPYETALLNQRGAPGFDTDIITDEALLAAVNEAWPMAMPPEPPGTPTTETAMP